VIFQAWNAVVERSRRRCQSRRALRVDRLRVGFVCD
jgi:hypothetical protein